MKTGYEISFSSCNQCSKRHALFADVVLTHIFILQHLIGISTNVIITGGLCNISLVIYVSCCYIAFFIMAYKLEDAVKEFAAYGITEPLKEHFPVKT